jgi:hypothetical protein
MVTVHIEGDRVRFEVQGWDKLWALKSQIEIPLKQIVSARVDPEPARGWFHGLRIPGTEIPGVITAGTFYTRDGIAFYDIHDPEKAIVVEVDDEHYKRLVVEVENPEQSVAELRAAIATAGIAGGA